jgi:D-alanine-D-alanine ligase
LYYLNDYQELLAYPDALPVKTNQSRLLDSLLVQGRLAIPADVVFPVVHGPLYEDGCFQGLLELADIAYVGCDVLSSAVGMDKDIARRLVRSCGIASARYHVLSNHLSATQQEERAHQVIAELGWPLFVKPCCMGSSVGIHKVHTLDELLRAIKDAGRYDEDILIEECIKGREIEVAVLEHTSPSSSPKVSLAGEIRVHHHDGFYSYDAKYLESDQTELSAPAEINEPLLHRLQYAAAQIFTALKCKGMARVDFFVKEDHEEIVFSEINTLPGFTPISMYPKLWEVSGLSYAHLLNQLIDLALSRHRRQQQLVTHYQ